MEAGMSNRAPSILVDFNQMAILLDVDGALLDFAPTPREVFVSRESAKPSNFCGSAPAAPSPSSAAGQYDETT